MISSMEHIHLIKEKDNIVLINKKNLKWAKITATEFFALKSRIEQDFDFREKLIQNNSLFARETSLHQDIDIKSIYYIVTRLCNMNCSFCSMASGKNINTYDNLKVEDFRDRVVDKLKYLNPKKIVISGGEPLTRNDLVDIVREIRCKLPNVFILLQTNGLLLSHKIWKDIEQHISGIEISVEHLLNDGFVMDDDLLLDISNSKVKLYISYVFDINKENDIERVLKFGLRYNAKVSFRIASEIGLYSLEVNNKIAEVKILDMYLAIIDFIVKNKLNEPEIISDLIFDLKVGKSCGANGKTLTILHDGYLTICPNLREPEFKFGHILETEKTVIREDLKRLLNRRDILNVLDVERIDYCTDCEYKYFCVGVCAGENSAGKINYDPKCTIKKILIKFNLFYYDNTKDYIFNLNKLRNLIESEKRKIIG